MEACNPAQVWHCPADEAFAVLHKFASFAAHWQAPAVSQIATNVLPKYGVNSKFGCDVW
jgi:hypothetical protein